MEAYSNAYSPGTVPASPSVRLFNAFNLPIPTRCEEVSRLIEECSSKDLQQMFPVLVENIFGFSSQVNWGISTLVRNNNPRDYDTLRYFLSPNGSLFRLAYKLLADNTVYYEFPISCLPGKTIQWISKGAIPSFYISKVQVDPQTRNVRAVALNAFEFLIFHFAYALVNPWQQEQIQSAWFLGDILYSHLLEDYLDYFLPCNGNVVPDPPFTLCLPSPAISPLQTPAYTRPARTPKFFRDSVVQQLLIPSTAMHSTPQSNVPGAQAEVWRSEVLAQTLFDFWLNQDEQTSSRYRSACQTAVVYSAKHDTFSNSEETLLPSVAQVRAVRMLIKHVHYFCNCQIKTFTALDGLRKTLIPSTQVRLYGFLRHVFNKWPLDCSFRFVLESWLSYVQPWRYTDVANRLSPRQRLQETETAIERSWQNFIAENLLFYTAFFQKAIYRFARMDLSSPRNVLMLLRLTKVFSQPELNRLIMEIESGLVSEQQGHSPAVVGTLMTGSPTSVSASRWRAIVHRHISEVEGPGATNYIPMFGEEFKAQMKEFLGLITQVLHVAKEVVATEEAEVKSQKFLPSFIATVTELITGSPKSMSDEYTLDDRKKVVFHLETSRLQICNIFQFQITDDELEQFARNSYGGTPFTTGTPLCSILKKRSKSECVPAPVYQGDPDLIPISSFEVAWLVRVLYALSCRLNEAYGRELQQLYYRKDWMGRIARQLLAPPAYYYRTEKRYMQPATKHKEALPPRVNLRWLANKRGLVYTFIFFCLSYFFKYHPLLVLLMGIVFFFLYILIKASLEHWFPASHTEDVPNFSASAPEVRRS